MTNEFLTFLFFFVPIVLFGLSLMVFYSIGIVKTNPEMTKLALISLISFSISVFASEFFYGKDSMCDMTKAIAFSSIKDVIPFAMVISAFMIMIIEVLERLFFLYK